jgi:hypothetical protein
MKQIAKELDAHFFLDSFAQNTDPGELTGFPVAETKVTRDGKEEWVSNNILTHYITAGYSVCSGDSYRTSYAMPKKIKEMWEIRNNYEADLIKFEAGETDPTIATIVKLIFALDMVNELDHPCFAKMCSFWWVEKDVNKIVNRANMPQEEKKILKNQILERVYVE